MSELKEKNIFCYLYSEKKYERRGKGSYILFFQHDSRRLAIDATTDDGTFGRLINHSATSPNISMKVVAIEGRPVVVFTALKDLEEGHEVQYDYGEKRPEVLKDHPWLRV